MFSRKRGFLKFLPLYLIQLESLIWVSLTVLDKVIPKSQSSNFLPDLELKTTYIFTWYLLNIFSNVLSSTEREGQSWNVKMDLLKLSWRKPGLMQGQNQNFICKILVNLGKTVGFEGRSMKGLIVEVQQNFNPIWFGQWVYWPDIEFINYQMKKFQCCN